jgi:putative membrane protein (TIGR04086 family)
MNIRWMAVLTGFLVDLVATLLLFALVFPQTVFSSQATQTNDPLSIALGLLATGVGGYVAGRMGGTQRMLHGLLVGVVGILMVQFELAFGGQQLSRADVLALAAGCLVGALGGALSHYPAQRQIRS